MSEVKSTGVIGRLYKQKITDKNGNPDLDDKGVQKEEVRIYFTQDAVVKQGQLAFCNYIEEDYKKLEELNKLNGESADSIISKIRTDDDKADRTTLCRVNLGKPPEAKTQGNNL
jgi:hypothetical protein